jgi:two-component system sensor histidine kinase PilS (NtrC family)
MPLRLVVFLIVFGSIVISLRSNLDLYQPLFGYSSITLLFLLSTIMQRNALFVRSHRVIVLLQLLSELAIEALIVYSSGYLSSPFSGLFVLTIVSAALAYRLVGTLFVATFASAAYALAIWSGTGAMITQAFSLRVLEQLYLTNDDLFFTVFIHLCIFYLAAFIAGYLADRIRAKDKELLKASENLKQARLETDEILKHLQSGLITVDNLGRIVYFNHAAEKITGYKESAIKGKNCLEVFQKRMPLFAEKIFSVLKSSQHDIRSEVAITRLDGSEIPLGMSTSVLGDDRYGVRGVVAIFQDLTHAKSIEERMRRADRLAAVGELAAGIAHEIRNPLAAISGSVEVLKGELECVDENGRLMNLILKESSRLNHILSEFLDYARVQRPTFVKVEVNHLVLDVFEIVRHHQSYHEGISLEHRSANTTEYISGDEEMFKQFLINLVVNAVEAIGEKRGKVTVTVERSEGIVAQGELQGFEWIRLSVADNGPGLAEKDRKRMFEPFFSSKKNGVGLGLPIVKRIVDSLGGRIEVGSTSTSGAVFTVHLKRYIDGLPTSLQSSAPAHRISEQHIQAFAEITPIAH